MRDNAAGDTTRGGQGTQCVVSGGGLCRAALERECWEHTYINDAPATFFTKRPDEEEGSAGSPAQASAAAAAVRVTLLLRVEHAVDANGAGPAAAAHGAVLLLLLCTAVWRCVHMRRGFLPSAAGRLASGYSRCVSTGRAAEAQQLSLVLQLLVVILLHNMIVGSS